jgi:PAS domain S-box-containing protein
MPITTSKKHQAEENELPTVFSLLESLQTPAFIIHPDGRSLAVNSLFASRIGKTPDVCIGQNIYGLFVEDCRLSPLAGVLETQCASVLLSGKGGVFEDGNLAWKVTLNPVRSATGAITSLFVSLQEISRSAERFEERTRAHPEKLASALKGSGAGIWEWTLKTGEFDWFGDVGSIFGIETTHPGHSFESFRESIYPDDRENISRSIQEAARTARAIDIEFRVARPDGSVRWILMRGNPGYRNNGEPDRYTAAVLDITERKLAEEELRKSNATMKLALKVSRVGIWEKDLRDYTLFWSDTMWELLGLDSRQETLSFALWEKVLHPEDLEVVKKAGEAIAIGEKMNIEYRTCHADGSIRWFMTRGMPVWGEDGSYDRYIGAIIDITAQKFLEQELIESKIRYDHALDAVHAGIWEWNARTDEIYWTPQLWWLHGLKPGSKTLNQQLCLEVIHPEDREKVYQSIAAAIKNLRTSALEYRTIHSDGTVHWISARCIPILDAQGELQCYIGAVLDITAHKQSEHEPLENRKRLTLALEAAHAGIWEWNSETGSHIWSDEMWPLHGLCRNEGLKPSFSLWTDSIHPDDREMAIWGATAAARQQRELNIEYRTIHEDGSIHWLMSRGKPRPDGYGKSVSYIGTVIDITDRKIAEIRLSESKFRFNFALEVTGAGIWEWDVQTDRLFWSDQIWKLYGLESQGSISSHKLFGINVHPEDRDRTFQTITSASKRRVDFSAEYRVCHPDGSVHWLMCRGVPLQSSDTLPGSYLGMIMDVTDRKRAEEERRKSQKQLNLVIEQGDIGVWTIDLRDLKAQRTLQYARIFGYDSVEAEWSLEAFLDHVVPEERETIREKIKQCCKTHLNHTFECKIRTADKRLRWIWVFGTFNYDTSTRTYYLSGIVQDITVRKQAELLLKESEQKFRNIFEFSPVAIGIGGNRGGALFDVNASWLRLFGYSKEEVIGKKLGDLGMYLNTGDHYHIIHDLREHGRVSNRQLELRNREGKTITVLFSAESITIAGQSNMLLMMSDITVQELQQASINQLEQAVAERTELLQEEVERLNRFLSMISHEYRTPLAIIRGNLDLIVLKHKSGDYSQQREIDKIKQAIDRLVEVMEVSIQESRLRESSEGLVVTNVQVEPTILSQLEAFRSMWPERVIRYAGQPDGAEIIGEQGQFGMAIFNLLDNARKYSPAESPIELECRVENGEVIITIRNEGKSISSTETGELFEKYRRGSNAANTGGAGIGLWLVKDIIEHHHGSVTLRGTGSGVEAVVTLPLAGNKV